MHFILNALLTIFEVLENGRIVPMVMAPVRYVVKDLWGIMYLPPPQQQQEEFH